MLTAGHTAHEDSPDFIPKLAEWIKYVCNEPSMTHVKMLGICFGHQIIARALGGRCERGQQGWELGVHAVRLSAEGERWFQGSKNSNSIVSQPRIRLPLDSQAHSYSIWSKWYVPHPNDGADGSTETTYLPSHLGSSPL